MNRDFKPYLAGGVLIFAFSYFTLAAVLGFDINDQILIAIVGWGGMVLGYYFGSSTGAAKKDETINNLTQPTKMNKYDVVELSDSEANGLAEIGKDAFKCTYDGKYYTYPENFTRATVEITDNENDNMFIIEWNGGSPIANKPRKMFPR